MFLSSPFLDVLVQDGHHHLFDRSDGGEVHSGTARQQSSVETFPPAGDCSTFRSSFLGSKVVVGFCIGSSLFGMGLTGLKHHLLRCGGNRFGWEFMELELWKGLGSGQTWRSYGNSKPENLQNKTGVQSRWLLLQWRSCPMVERYILATRISRVLSG